MKIKKLFKNWALLFGIFLLISNTYATWAIQTLIDTALNGDTVVVPAGTYYETWIIINKPLTLNGNGVTIDWSAWEWTLISIQSSNITVDWFTLTNIKWYWISTKDVEAWYTNIVIKNNTINNISNILIWSTKQYPSWVGIYIWYMSWFFVYNPNLQKSSSNILDYAWLDINHNTISNVSNWIALQSVKSSWTRLNISNNNISNMNSNANWAAIRLDNVKHLDIDSNTWSAWYHGINITSYSVNFPWQEYTVTNWSTESSDIKITNNTLTNMIRTDWYDGNWIDIYWWDIESIIISNNTFAWNANHDILWAYIGNFPIHAETGNTFTKDVAVDVKYMPSPWYWVWAETTWDNWRIWTWNLIATGCVRYDWSFYYPKITFNLPLSEVDMISPDELELDWDTFAGWYLDTLRWSTLLDSWNFSFKRIGSDTIINYTVDILCP